MFDGLFLVLGFLFGLWVYDIYDQYSWLRWLHKAGQIKESEVRITISRYQWYLFAILTFLFSGFYILSIHYNY